YGPLVRLGRGGRGDFLVGVSPEFNRQLLSAPGLYHNGDRDHVPLGPPPDTAAYRLASGLTAMNGPKHVQQRRLMMPAFHRRRVESYHATMVRLTERALAGWQAGEVRLVQREMKDLALAVALKILLGLDLSTRGDTARK